MHKITYSLFLGMVFLLSPFNLFGIEDQDSLRIIKDLKRSLLIYSPSQDSYVPHAHNTPLKGNVVSVNLNVSEFIGHRLFICGQPNTALFIDQKIIDSQTSDKCISLSIDSLYDIYGNDLNKESLFITVYHKDLDINDLQFSIVQKLSDREISLLDNKQELNVIARNFSPFKNFYVIGLLLIMFFIAMVKGAYPKIFHEFYSVSKIFSFRWREDSLIANRPINTVNILFLIVYSLTMAFIVVVLWHKTGSLPRQLNFIDFTDFYSTLFSWIGIALFIFVLIIVKYFVIYISSSLLGFKDLIIFHFLDFVRISQLFMFMLLIVISLSMISFPNFVSWESDIFFYIVLSCILLTTTLLFFKLLSSTNYRNMHLFSYLCTTEILPLIISIKFFLNL